MNLAKREKIIVLALILTALYGLYSLVFAPTSASGPQDSHPEIEALKAFTRNLAKEMDATNDKSKALYIIEKAAAAWYAEPFLQNDLPRDGVKVPKELPASPAGAPRWHFSGFLEAGPKRLAVINGMEYEEGEWLEDGGHKVAQILPTHVVIEVLETQVKTIVPLDESLEFFDSGEIPPFEKAQRAIAGHES